MIPKKKTLPTAACNVEWRKPRVEAHEYKRPSVPRETRVWAAFGNILGDIAGKADGETLTQDEVLCYAAAASTGYKPTDARFWKTYDAHMAAQGGRKPTAKDALWRTLRTRLPAACACSDNARIDQDDKDGWERVIAFLHLDREALWSEAEDDATKKENK